VEGMHWTDLEPPKYPPLPSLRRPSLPSTGRPSSAHRPPSSTASVTVTNVVATPVEADDTAPLSAIPTDKPLFNPVPGMRQLLKHCWSCGLLPDPEDEARADEVASRHGIPREHHSGQEWLTPLLHACLRHDPEHSGRLSSAALAEAIRDSIPGLISGAEFAIVEGMGLQGARFLDYEDLILAAGAVFDADRDKAMSALLSA
jgi:hypothetical protein